MTQRVSQFSVEVAIRPPKEVYLAAASVSVLRTIELKDVRPLKRSNVVVVAGDGAALVGPQPQPHRFWSMLMRHPVGYDFLGISQIELREGPLGTNRAPGATVYTDKVTQAGSVADIVDGTPSDSIIQYSNEARYDTTIAFDFGDGNAYAITHVKIWPNKDSASRSPGRIEIMYSDNGTDWFSDGWFIGFKDWVTATPVEFVKPINLGVFARFWRLYDFITNPADELNQFNEIELRSTIGGVDQTGAGTATSFDNYGGQGPENAVDDDIYSVYAAGSGSSPRIYWQYDFGEGVTKQIVEISMTARDGYVARTPVSFSIARSNDGKSWIKHAMPTFPDDTWAASQTQIVSF